MVEDGQWMVLVLVRNEYQRAERLATRAHSQFVVPPWIVSVVFEPEKNGNGTSFSVTCVLKEREKESKVRE